MTQTIKPLFTWRSAVAESDLAPTTRHVALALSLYMGERGNSAYPGAVRLGKDTGLSDRCVREHLGLLERAGFLRVVKRGGLKGETRRATEYEARTPEPALPMTVDNGSSSEHAPLNLTTPTPEPGSPQYTSELSSELSIPAKRAQEVANTFWEQADPKPSHYMGLLTNCRTLLEAGWTADELAVALPQAKAFTLPAIEFVLRGGNQRSSVGDDTVASGRRWLGQEGV